MCTQSLLSSLAGKSIPGIYTTSYCQGLYGVPFIVLRRESSFFASGWGDSLGATTGLYLANDDDRSFPANHASHLRPGMLRHAETTFFLRLLDMLSQDRFKRSLIYDCADPLSDRRASSFPWKQDHRAGEPTQSDEHSVASCFPLRIAQGRAAPPVRWPGRDSA
jgi:hypothetical protein